MAEESVTDVLTGAIAELLNDCGGILKRWYGLEIYEVARVNQEDTLQVSVRHRGYNHQLRIELTGGSWAKAPKNQLGKKIKRTDGHSGGTEEVLSGVSSAGSNWGCRGCAR